ncbi:alpha-L-rhamnosidase C-terminal domain-containing protein [Amycolatopsis sp. lyj-109]
MSSASAGLDGEELRLRVTVPPGTSATVVLPSGRQETARPGTHEFTDG